MRYVLANRILLSPGGTEVHLVTVGEHLRRLGHEVVLFAPEIGSFAEHARGRGLEVRDCVRELPDDCDVVLAQDAIVVYDLARRYPKAVTVFRVCGDVYDFQLPPQIPGLVDLVVVLSDRYERIARAGPVQAPILRLRVPIDVDRLVPAGPIRERPERAVLLGNYVGRDDWVRDTWGRAGVDVWRVGAKTQADDVAAALADVDVVVAKSRAALDAMACGKAVYVYDVFGGDGWVTPDLYPALEADHFAGQATDRVIDPAVLERDLAGYRPEMGVVNRDLVLQHHNARDHVVALLQAIGERAPQDRVPAPLEELARLASLQWSWEETARGLKAEAGLLTAELESARATLRERELELAWPRSARRLVRWARARRRRATRETSLPAPQPTSREKHRG